MRRVVKQLQQCLSLPNFQIFMMGLTFSMQSKFRFPNNSSHVFGVSVVHRNSVLFSDFR